MSYLRVFQKRICKRYVPVCGVCYNYSNFAEAWPLPSKLMPPLAYTRQFVTTKNRKLVEPLKKRAFELAGLRPVRMSASPSYAKKLARNQNQKSRTRPAFMIQRSTKIFGEIPMVDDLQRNLFDSPRTGYFFEKSEVQISPMNDIFREKRYSLKAFFDDLSGKAFSKRATRFRRATNNGEAKNEEVENSDQAENASRLLSILARNYQTENEDAEDLLGNRNSARRTKRQVSEEEVQKQADEEEKYGKQASNDSKNRKTGYTPVFKECNDTAASEISDLNAPPPSPQRRLTLHDYSRNGESLKDIDFERRKNSEIIEKKEIQLSKIPATVPPAVDEEDLVEPSKEMPLTIKHTPNATYINLQDHQKGTEDGEVPKDANGYPLDILPYNPDVIPYVDVPDYSDQREESLDKDDRRVAKEKYVEYPDEDADVIDPGVPLKSDKRSEKIIIRDDDFVKDDEVAEQPNNSKSRDVEEEVNERKEAEVEEAEEEEEDGSSRISNDSDSASEEKENGETTSKDTRNSEAADDVKDFEPIHFDIDEYRKPFDLEELFKDVEKEAEKSVEKNKTKLDVNEHQGSKNVPVREDGHKISRASEPHLHDDDDLKAFGESEQRENHEHSDENKKNDPQDATIAPPNFFKEFDRVFGPEISETPFTGYFDDADQDDKERTSKSSALVEIEDDKYPYGDENKAENTYERLFGTRDDGNKSEPIEAEDDETYHKQGSDDYVTDFHRRKKNSETETEAEEPIDESLREAYKTLATILDRKDDVSRLDDEVAEKAKKEGKMPQKYNNYWTLEYGTPREEEKT